MKNYIFPEIFELGYIPEDRNNASVLADGLSAWGIIMASGEMPKNFREVMVLIGKRLGISATPTSLMELSNKYLK